MGDEREQARDENRAMDLFHKAKSVASYWTRRIDVVASSRKRMRDWLEPLEEDFRHVAKGNVLAILGQ
jgi:hypothetical protein